MQQLENKDEEGATIWVLNIIKHTIIWTFIIELASEATPSKLPKIQVEENRIDKDTDTEDWGLKANVTSIERKDVED